MFVFYVPEMSHISNVLVAKYKRQPKNPASVGRIRNTGKNQMIVLREDVGGEDEISEKVFF